MERLSTHSIKEFVINASNGDFEVRYKPEMLKIDLESQFHLRGMRPDLTRKIMECFEIEINGERTFSDFGGLVSGQAEMDFATKLERSIIKVTFMNSDLFKEEDRSTHLITDDTKEADEQSIIKTLEGFWKHEREHILQHCLWDSLDREIIDNHEKGKNEVIVKKYKSIKNFTFLWVSTAASVANFFVTKEIGFHFIGQTLMSTLGSYYLASKMEEYGTKEDIYRNSFIEQVARYHQNHGKCLSGMFEVKKI